MGAERRKASDSARSELGKLNVECLATDPCNHGAPVNFLKKSEDRPNDMHMYVHAIFTLTPPRPSQAVRKSSAFLRCTSKSHPPVDSDEFLRQSWSSLSKCRPSLWTSPLDSLLRPRYICRLSRLRCNVRGSRFRCRSKRAAFDARRARRPELYGLSRTPSSSAYPLGGAAGTSRPCARRLEPGCFRKEGRRGGGAKRR